MGGRGADSVPISLVSLRLYIPEAALSTGRQAGLVSCFVGNSCGEATVGLSEDYTIHIGLQLT